jgi:hypothetical protein
VSNSVAVIQTILSYFQDGGDTLQSIRAGQLLIAFLIKEQLIYVAVSPFCESERQLSEQLVCFHSHVVSIFTTVQLTKLFEQRVNFDLRRLLFGSEGIFDALSSELSSKGGIMLGSVQCLRMPVQLRDKIGQALLSINANKAFSHGFLFAKGKLITLVRPRKQSLHPHDIYAVQNMALANASFGGGEIWTPICLPKANATGFVFAYIYYLTETLCMIFISNNKEGFFEASECKEQFVEALVNQGIMEQLKSSVAENHYCIADVGIPGLRHFVFKSKATLQYSSPDLAEPFANQDDFEILFKGYQFIHRRLSSKTSAMIHYHGSQTLTTFGWNSNAFEIYVTMAPFISKSSAAAAVNNLIRWIQKEEDSLFITKPPVF